MLSFLRSWRKIPIFHTLLFITFLVSGIIINVLQYITFFLIAWHNLSLFRRINYYFIYAIYGQILFLGDWWSRSRLRVHYERGEGQPPAFPYFEPFHTHSIIMMNHHYEVDWLAGWMSADRVSVLGNCRVIAKKVLGLTPIMGWSWFVSDGILVHRKWEKDKDILANSIKRLGDFPSPMWLCLFAEGTRLTPQKLETSQIYSRKNGLPVLQHHLQPRTRGFNHIIQNLDRDKIKYILDTTVCINGDEKDATLSNILRGNSVDFDVYVRRVPIASLPKDDEGLSKWLIDLYVQKDKAKQRYYETGTFSDDVEMIDVPARPYTLILTVTLNILMAIPLVKLFTSMVFFGSWFQAIIAISSVVIVNLAMGAMIDISRISKATSYGLKNGDSKKKH